MKILIEPPTWLGDSVMASGTINEILKNYKNYQKIFLGSYVASELFKDEFDKIIIDNKKNRFKNLLKLERVDVFISFRRSLYSKIIGLLKAKKSYFFNKQYSGHMVEKYSNYINEILNLNSLYPPILKTKKISYKKPTLGIKPGANYGSAKRWYPKEFAKVANELGKKYDVIIFGGPGEEEIAKDIEKNLTIKNYKNLCGKLSIKELAEHIGGLDLFITNDSGPMHIAAAFKVPVVAIFGPTKYNETSPFNTKNKIVTKDLECAPCMKRECPLKHHNCMKLITAKDVIKAVEKL